jgi:hypothetical protein
MCLHKITGILLLLSCCGWAGIIQNPSFEIPILSPDGYAYRPPTNSGQDWVFTGSAGISANGSPFGLGPDGYPAPDGSQVAFIQKDTGNQASIAGNVSQAISGLSASTLYTLSFDAGQRPETDSATGFVFGGGLDFYVYWCPTGSSCGVIDFVQFDNVPSTDLSFIAEAVSFTPGATSGSLQFQAFDPLGGDRTDFIDNVQLVVPNDGAVPEPSNGFLVLSGIGLIGLGLRRRLVHSRSLAS